MKKFLLAIAICLMTATGVMCAEVPQEVKDFINKDFPETNFRFDGAIILPDNTMYLPLFPSKAEKVEEVKISEIYPTGETMKNKPEMVILNNRYALLKVININGKKTVIDMAEFPEEIQSSLLPQEILLPKGLVIPKSLEGIIGDIDVTVSTDTGLRINNLRTVNKKTTPVSELDNKSFYIATGMNKNIQVVSSDSKTSAYALEQNAVINDIKCYDGKFLLVTYFDSKTMNVISLMDEKVIKQVNFETIPEQIIIDNKNKIAYISSGSDSSIYVFSLETMTLKKQLKINGKCDKLVLSEDSTKLFYVDRLENAIWSIEIDNNYKLKNIGIFPNISDIAFTDEKMYIVSRTRNRLAIVDYGSDVLIKELHVCEKPVRLYIKDKDLYILGASEDIMEVLNTEEDVITDILYLKTDSFATNITPIENSDLIMVTNAKAGNYSIIDTNTKDIIKTSPLDVPVRAIVVTDKIQTIK
jgi:DNA-binding beta-propeller fold protein YncE